MAYQIYWGAGSPYSWRVVLALEVMGIEYESRLLEFSTAQHKTPAMLAMNPRGRLPVLKDGDTVIYESIAIIAYLNSKHPELPLFGSTPSETGFIWQRIFEIESYLTDALTGVIVPIFFDDVVENTIAITTSANEVDIEFKILEARFETNDYIAGDRITAADIALFPAVRSLPHAMSLAAARDLDVKFKEFDKHYPNITQWIKRIEALPGYQKTFPPNWKN